MSSGGDTDSTEFTFGGKECFGLRLRFQKNYVHPVVLSIEDISFVRPRALRYSFTFPSPLRDYSDSPPHFLLRRSL